MEGNLVKGVVRCPAKAWPLLGERVNRLYSHEGLRLELQGEGHLQEPKRWWAGS